MNNSTDYHEYDRWKSWNSSDFGRVRAHEAAYYAREMQLSGLPSLSGMNVLELGFGNGGFGAWAHAQRANYAGVEAIEALVQLGMCHGWIVHRADTPLALWVEPDSIDLVVAFDVFEHLPILELERLLIDLVIRLKTGGQLVARIPSGDSPFGRAIQYGDLTHRTILGSSAVRQLALRSGFEVVAVRPPANPWSGDGWLRTCKRALVDIVRRLVYSAIAACLMGGGSPVLSPNLLMVLRKPLSRRHENDD